LLVLLGARHILDVSRLWNLNFLDRFPNNPQILNLIKIHPVGTELFHPEMPKRDSCCPHSCERVWRGSHACQQGEAGELACIEVVAATSSQGRRRPTVGGVLQPKILDRCMFWPSLLTEQVLLLSLCVCVCLFVSDIVLLHFPNCNGQILAYLLVVLSFCSASLSANCKGYDLCAYVRVTLTLWETQRLCSYCVCLFISFSDCFATLPQLQWSDSYVPVGSFVFLFCKFVC